MGSFATDRGAWLSLVSLLEVLKWDLIFWNVSLRLELYGYCVVMYTLTYNLLFTLL